MDTATRRRPPSPGSPWRPLDFDKFARLARQAAASRGWGPIPWDSVPYDGDAAVVGGMSLILPGWNTGDARLPFAAWTLSHVRGVGPRFYAGCSGPGVGAVVFDGWPLARRQTEYFDTVSAVEESLDRWAEVAHRMPALVQRLRSREVYATARELLFEAGRRELVAQSRVFDAYEAFLGSDQTAWDLLTSFGAVAARGPASRRLPAMLAFYRHVTRGIA
jgi:hypothetical protein